MTARDGTAREVTPGRLAAFEEGGLGDETIPRLPPRPRPASARPAAAPAAEAPPTPASAEARPVRPRSGSRARRASSLRASNVYLPVALLDPISARCKAEGISHGDLIVRALEATYEALPTLVDPVRTTGGSLFAERRTRAPRQDLGPMTPLNYRLREEDFAVLDRLVEETNAPSRSQLIAAALSAYLG